MSINLNHRNLSGFFPAAMPNYDAKTYPYSFPIPLATLMRIFWLSSSFDWSVDIAYDFTQNQGGGITLNDTGTTTGSGTINAGNGNYGPSPVPVGGRTFWSQTAGQIDSSCFFPFGMYGLGSGQISTISAGSTTVTGTVPEPYSINTGAIISWPCSFANLGGFAGVSQGKFGGFAAFDAGSGLYYCPMPLLTGLSVGQYSVGWFGISGQAAWMSQYSGSPAAPIQVPILHLQVNGTDIVAPSVIPIGFGNESSADTVTGSIIVNFNNFLS